jgi:antitoxin MazE
MVTTIAKWGDSLAVRLPQHLIGELQFAEGVEVDLVVVDGQLVVKPRIQGGYSLEDLVAAITPENCHAEVESGVAVGNEVW